jgi:anamorsin
MAPSFVTIDNTPDFNFMPQPKALKEAVDSVTRTLLIAPPSIASHEEKLHGILAVHDRSATDLQMLDRISAGLARLPPATYDLVLILTDVDGTRSESGKLLSRDVYSSLVQSLKAGGKVQSQDGTFGQSTTSGEYTEAILAGLVANSAGGMMKPDYSASEAVPLRFGRSRKKDAVSDAGPPATIVTLKRKSVEAATSKSRPNGVGFVDFSDDFGEEITGEDDDDDLIDEDTLLTEDDLTSMIVIRMSSTPPTTR